MYTNRRTFVVKRGKMQAAIELFKTSYSPPDRIYGSGIGSGYLDMLIVEWDSENLAEYEHSVMTYFSAPEYASFQEKLNELTETGGHNEILHRHK